MLSVVLLCGRLLRGCLEVTFVAESQYFYSSFSYLGSICAYVIYLKVCSRLGLFALWLYELCSCLWAFFWESIISPSCLYVPTFVSCSLLFQTYDEVQYHVCCYFPST